MPNYTRQISHNVMVAVMLISLQLLVVDTDSILFDSSLIDRLEIVLRVAVVLLAVFSFVSIVSDDCIPRGMILTSLCFAVALVVIKYTAYTQTKSGAEELISTVLMTMGPVFVLMINKEYASTNTDDSF